MENNAIVCRGISKSFDDKQVLKDFSCEIPYGVTTVLRGASGSGKTTLIRIIAGLEKQDQGEIQGVNTERIAFLFQDDRLLPWLSVRQNVEAVIKDRERVYLAAKVLSELGLQNELDAYPAQLSGGMCRRVAIARALVYYSDVLILDEALRGLDEKNIENTVAVIKKYSQGKTIISVTHSPSSLEDGAAQILQL